MSSHLFASLFFFPLKKVKKHTGVSHLMVSSIDLDFVLLVKLQGLLEFKHFTSAERLQHLAGMVEEKVSLVESSTFLEMGLECSSEKTCWVVAFHIFHAR